jgi:hypothetical protein
MAVTHFHCHTMDYEPNILIRVETKAVTDSHWCQLQYRSIKTQIGDPLFWRCPMLPLSFVLHLKSVARWRRYWTEIETPPGMEIETPPGTVAFSDVCKY